MDLHFVENVGNEGHRTMMKIRLNNLGNLGSETNIDQKHEWIFDSMVQIFTRKHEMICW